MKMAMLAIWQDDRDPIIAPAADLAPTGLGARDKAHRDEKDQVRANEKTDAARQRVGHFLSPLVVLTGC